MKIFIPSFRRPMALTTPFLLEEDGVTDYVILLRNFAEYRAYSQNPKLRRSSLIVLPEDRPLNAAREYARSLVATGEWVLFCDDNIKGFLMPKLRFYRDYSEVPLKRGEKMVTRLKWQSTLNVRVSFRKFYEEVVLDTIMYAEAQGAQLAGFSPHENPAFRQKKWTNIGYCNGKMFVVQKSPLHWNQCQNIGSAGEDYALTAAFLLEHGKVIVNRWGHPERRHYEPGGCGVYRERLSSMIAAQQDLMGRYPGLLCPKHGTHEGELRLRFHTLEQVEKWRTAMMAAGCDPNYRDPLAVSPAA